MKYLQANTTHREKTFTLGIIFRLGVRVSKFQSSKRPHRTLCSTIAVANLKFPADMIPKKEVTNFVRLEMVIFRTPMSISLYTRLGSENEKRQPCIRL